MPLVTRGCTRDHPELVCSVRRQADASERRAGRAPDSARYARAATGRPAAAASAARTCCARDAASAAHALIDTPR
jgi:hypothetical protein